MFWQVRVANYWEALGIIAAHKAGINPQALRRNGIKNIHRIQTPGGNTNGSGSLKRLEPVPAVMSAVC